MAFLENLGKKVGEVAQTAAKKSGELVEITKLNMNISSEEDKIQRLFAKMGKVIYDMYCSEEDTPEAFKEDCEAVKAHKQNIEGFRAKIREIKNSSACANCGAEIYNTSAFCSKCGAKVE
jgi:hypothetical protein